MRRRNYNEPGHAHELTFSCYRGFPFLKKDRVCQWLMDAINAARLRWEFHVWAYVFMPEHVHLIIYPSRHEYDIARIRTAIKEPVSKRAVRFLSENAPQWLPRITRQHGNRTEHCFWQGGGGYDRNIMQGQTLLAMIDYIHMNPVRRGLVEQAIDWKWSSAGWYIAGRTGPLSIDPIPPDWLD